MEFLTQHNQWSHASFAIVVFQFPFSQNAREEIVAGFRVESISYINVAAEQLIGNIGLIKLLVEQQLVWTITQAVNVQSNLIMIK